jgi:hypothetical protein
LFQLSLYTYSYHNYLLHFMINFIQLFGSK